MIIEHFICVSTVCWYVWYVLHVIVMFLAVSLMPVADRPASTGDVSASPISRCHSYDLRAKSFSVPTLKQGRASMSNMDSPSSASPFVPSKRRRLSSYGTSTSPSGILCSVFVILPVDHKFDFEIYMFFLQYPSKICRISQVRFHRILRFYVLK